jgi:hypothetical protein
LAQNPYLDAAKSASPKGFAGSSLNSSAMLFGLFFDEWIERQTEQARKFL